MYWNLFRPAAFRIMNELLPGGRSLSELSLSLEMSKPTLQQRYLNDLVEMGIIEKNILKTSKGREVRYRLLPFNYQLSIDPKRKIALNFMSNNELDPRFPLLNQIRDRRSHDDLKIILDLIVDDPALPVDISIILYGSLAKRTSSEKSDIDLLFLREEWNNRQKDTFINLLADITYKLQHRISPQFMTFDDMKKQRSAFVDEIKGTGIIIHDGNGGGGDIWEEMKIYKSISI